LNPLFRRFRHGHDHRPQRSRLRTALCDRQSAVLSLVGEKCGLVVSPDWFNSSNQDLVLVAITSQIGDDPRSVLLDDADFVGGKLPKRSMVKLAKVFTIHSALIGKRLCAITESKSEEMLKTIREFYS